MNALRILLLSVLILYLTIYHTSYWKYFFSVLIPYYIVTQLLLSSSKFNSPKKKSLISMWNSPSDPQIYGMIPFNITSLEKYLKEYSEKNGIKVGITVFFIKMMGLILEKYPQINGNVIFGKYVPKTNCDVSLMVAVHNKVETEIITVKNANKLSLSEISQKIHEKIESIEKHTDKSHNKRLMAAKLLPTFLLSPFVRILSFLSISGFNLSWLWLPKYAFGSCILSNLGDIDLDGCFLPIPPYTYAPLLIGLTKKTKKIKINQETGKLEEKISIKSYFTIDHRYLDGYFASKIAVDIDKYVNDPSLIDSSTISN